MLKLYLLLCSSFFYVLGYAAPPDVTSFSPTSASYGMTVTITGTNFTNITAVTFGGIPAQSFTVNSATQISAVIGNVRSGSVQVSNADGSDVHAGFIYVTVSRIITDFKGYWSSSMGAVNNDPPVTAHNLLGFSFNGTNYSTGVNDGVLSAQSVAFTAGNFKALPVAGIEGTSSGGSTYLAIARNIDGSPNAAYIPGVAGQGVRSVLTDGPKGLNLGTGVTNLPTDAIMNFRIFNIDPAKISDDEPDIIITQIADPSGTNDILSFRDMNGNIVGNNVTQNMTELPSFGTYGLDLFTLTPSTPYNQATAYSVSAGNVTRPIRLTAFKLSDFGITSGNLAQIKTLRITPSGNTDYAFIAYNANAINLTPNVSNNNARSNTTLCSAGTANLAVIATPADNGTLSYEWEESADGGNNWATVADGGNYAGATTDKLSVTSPSHGYEYRCTVTESGNPNPVTSEIFTITIVSSPQAPTDVTVGSTGSVCLHTPRQLTSTVTGGTNLSYQWLSNASGSFLEIPDATFSTYVPPVDKTGTVSYTVRVSSGSGCIPTLTAASPATLTVTGISSTTPAAVCTGEQATLSATATGGTITWYATDNGSSIAADPSYQTPALSSTTTYFVGTSACPSAARIPVVATVFPESAGGTINGGTTVLTGSNSTTLTVENITGNIVKWQSSTDDFNTDITDIPNTSNQYTATNLTQTTKYRCIVQSGTCAPAMSSLATIVVSGPLPIKVGSLTATRHNDGIDIQWLAYNQENTDHYEVERSVDGLQFRSIMSVKVIADKGPDVKYKVFDPTPAHGTNYYRIKEIGTGGQIRYSSVVNVRFENSGTGITVYPNPVPNRKFLLKLSGLPKGKYVISIINASGQPVHKFILEYKGVFQVYDLVLPSGITAGTYQLLVSGAVTTGKTLIVK